MSNELVLPEIVTTGIQIVSILPTGSSYGIIAISASGEIYSFKSLLKEPYFNKVNEIKFKVPCYNYISNHHFPYICGSGNRDYQIVDLDKHLVTEYLINSNGNERFFFNYFFGEKAPFLYLTVEHVGWNQNDSYEETYLHDFERKETTKIISDYYGSLLFQLNDSLFLREEMQRNNQPSKWHVFKTNINDKLTNDLSDTLTRIGFGPYKTSLNATNKILFCQSDEAPFTIYTLTWDPLFKDISLIPWTFQQPREYIIGKQFCFNPHGIWFRNTACRRDNTNLSFNAFYHISDKYPAHVSIPIFGMETNRSAPGAFLETPEWGTVYVDLSRGPEGVLMVYKMRDVMERIIARAKEMK